MKSRFIRHEVNQKSYNININVVIEKKKNCEKQNVWILYTAGESLRINPMADTGQELDKPFWKLFATDSGWILIQILYISWCQV